MLGKTSTTTTNEHSCAVPTALRGQLKYTASLTICSLGGLLAEANRGNMSKVKDIHIAHKDLQARRHTQAICVKITIDDDGDRDLRLPKKPIHM